MVVQTSIS